LQPAAQPNGYLDPGNAGPDGGRALAALLTERGEKLTPATTTKTEQNEKTTAGTTILVTNPELLTTAQLGSLARSTADIVLVDPDPVSLATLAPEISVADHTSTATLDPNCTLPAATVAGNADLGGTLLATKAQDAELCYPTNGHPSLISYRDAGRTITVLGTGEPLTNANLSNLGNAALAMNLLGAQPRLIWLTPQASPLSPKTPGQKSFTSLIPKPVYMVMAQLIIAVLLLALWRARRLGPIVAERLPVVVRAAETTEGHGRLYHARRSRGQAAQALRDAAASRLRPVLGLPPDAPGRLTAAMLATRIGEPTDETLDGPDPADDAALVALADRLDALERKAGVR
jgi:hypothetical protein